MKKIVDIYKCQKKEGAYIYVENGKDLASLPEILLKQTGSLEFSMTMLLTPDKKLAQANAKNVIVSIETNGFYLQMPPPQDFGSTIRNDKMPGKAHLAVSNDRFWETKSLAHLTPFEWESLCDGCGKCCLHKLEDDETEDVYYTDVACQYLDESSCSCKDYKNRLKLVPSCFRLDIDNVSDFKWLPVTCAYRRISEGKPLDHWHPLISGSRDSVHTAGMSVRYRVVSESEVNEDEMEERIIHWVV